MHQDHTPETLHAKIGTSALLMILLIFSLSVLSASSPSAQEDQKPKNLKILPESIPHDSLISIMEGFSDGLGVNCGFCHERSQTGRDLDFPSDAKNTKLTARDMMKMVGKLNDTYLTNLPTKSDRPVVQVECYTCHRGQPVPRLLQDVLKSALETNGMKALDSTYRDLRDKYYGSGTFNFSDETLAYLALNVSEKDPNDALAILKLNSEFNPKSLTNEWATGKIYVDQGDTTNAIAAFERALQIDPNNRRIQHDLQVLKGEARPFPH